MSKLNEELVLPPAHREEAAPPEVPEQAEARTRNMGEIRVGAVSPETAGKPWPTIGIHETDTPFDDVRAAERWIKDNGADGMEYVVLRLVSRHRVSVKTVETRSLVAVP